MVSSQSSKRIPLPPGWVAGAVLALAIGAVYMPARRVPFIFDDRAAIVRNASIKTVWPLVGTAEQPGPFQPAYDLPTCGRPLVNLSFAWNHYFCNLDSSSFHVVNIVLHFLCAFVLWCVVRRTLRLPYFSHRSATTAGWLALAAALLWALHPLQTEPVIYATQRTELMMAFFYLSTLYCSLRYWAYLPLPPEEGRGEGALKEDPHRLHRTVWLSLAILACLAGMASKEVMVSAPLMVLLFERTFISGSLGAAVRRSWPLYAGLAATWVLLVLISLQNPHGTSAGFGLGVDLGTWWLAQSKVFLMYLKLAFWPWPLLIHYQWPYPTSFGSNWMYAACVLLLVIGILVLLWRNSPAGYLGIWILAILSPTSIVPIPTEVAAERRMYLPLAAIVVLAVVGGYSVVQSIARRRTALQPLPAFRGVNFTFALPVLVIAVVFGLVSAQHLQAYEDETYLWKVVLKHYPDDYLARCNLGYLLEKSNLAEAIEELQTAVALNPNYGPALNNLGAALTHAGRPAEAVDPLQRALVIDPKNTSAYLNLGNAREALGQTDAAIDQYKKALSLDANLADVHYNLARALSSTGQLAQVPQAIEHLQAALALNADDPVVLDSLGIAFLRLQRYPEAIEKLQRAVQLKPKFVDAHNDLGLALFSNGQIPQAMEQYHLALELDPNDPKVHYNLGIALVKLNRPQKAIEHYQTALRARPDFLDACIKLIEAYTVANRPEEAIATAHRAIALARASQQPELVQLIEDWLLDYRAELRRTREPLPGSGLSPAATK